MKKILKTLSLTKDITKVIIFAVRNWYTPVIAKIHGYHRHRKCVIHSSITLLDKPNYLIT